MGWERTMAELALQLGDLQAAICHALQVGPARSGRQVHACALLNCQPVYIVKVGTCRCGGRTCVLCLVLCVLLLCRSAGAAPAGVPPAGAGAAAAALAWRATVLLHGACYERSSECCVVTLVIGLEWQQHATGADATKCPSAGGR